jgi:very-short-patch-repair endonuclease
MDLDATAQGQHGLVTFAQLTSLGVSASTARHWRNAGRLVAVQPRVYRVAGVPVTFRQQALAAVLSAGRGAAASHRAAGHIWGIYEGNTTVEIVVPNGRSARLWRPAVAHHTRDDIPIVRRDRVPTTSPMRTLVDLGAVCKAHDVEDALDRALVARLCTVAGVEWELARVARPGRRGAGVLHAVLDNRALGEQRPDGLLEPRFARLVRRFGLPTPRFQHRIGRHRVDFAWPDIKLAVEVDGYQHHGTRRAFQADRDRQNALVARGWTVLRFTWEDVVRRPEKVAAAVLAAIAV